MLNPHPSDAFWTSTPWAGSSSEVWIVNFSYGYASLYDVVGDFSRVRCVR